MSKFFKWILIVTITLIVTLFTCEYYSIFYIKEKYVELDINNIRYRKTEYILGIKVTDSEYPSHATKFVTDQTTDWKFCRGRKGLLFAKTPNFKYGVANAQLVSLLQILDLKKMPLENKKELTIGLQKIWQSSGNLNDGWDYLHANKKH